MLVATREHQSALRFLWLEGGIVQQYQYICLIFGATRLVVPFSFATFALPTYTALFPMSFEAVLNNFSMDSFIMSVATTEAARRLFSNLSTVLKRGGFRRTMFFSKNTAALPALPEEATELIPNKHHESTLSNLVSFKIHILSSSAKNNRSAANASSIFDPIGLLANSVIQHKVILQNF